MSAWIRWSALLLSVSSLSACVVYPAGYYRHDRYYGPPPRHYRYHDHDRREWGQAQPATPADAALNGPRPMA